MSQQIRNCDIINWRAMADEISFVPSNCGGELLLLHGHLLSINTNKNGKRYWKYKKAADCCVTAITEGNHLVSHYGKHTHASDKALPNIKVLTHRAKEMAKNQPTHPMKHIFNKVFGNVDLDNEHNMDHLPNLRNIKNSLYLSHASHLPRIPHSH